jgi:hypothetical protein
LKTSALFLVFILIVWLSAGCTTPRSSQHPDLYHIPSLGGLCPLSNDNDIQNAQKVVLDLEMKIAQAQYDLDSAKLQDRKNEIFLKRVPAQNKHDSKALAQLNHQLQDIERSRDISLQRLSLKAQWVDALRASDCIGAKISQDSLDHLR